jgi:hypothetical protein
VEQEASVLQQDVNWWLAKENVANFQARLEICTGGIRRPLIEGLLDQELENQSVLSKVIPHVGHTLGDKPKVNWHGATTGILWPLLGRLGAPSAKKKE